MKRPALLSSLTALLMLSACARAVTSPVLRPVAPPVRVEPPPVGGACAKAAAECAGNPACVAWLRCAESCEKPGDPCMEACANKTELKAMEAGNEYLFCTCCERLGRGGRHGTWCSMPTAI